MNLNEKINRLIEIKGLTNYRIAKVLGISATTIANYREGKTTPDTEILSKLAQYLGVKVDYLLDNNFKGSGISKPLSKIHINKKSEIIEKIDLVEDKRQAVKQKTIPYYPDINASAGMDFLAENGNNYNIPIRIPNVDAEAYINVFGDSMYPKYCSGEIIGIKRIEKEMVFFGHAYVIQMIDGEAYIKYIDPGKDDEHWLLRSENLAYKPKQFHLSKIRNIFVIKAVITKTTIL